MSKRTCQLRCSWCGRACRCAIPIAGDTEVKEKLLVVCVDCFEELDTYERLLEESV